MTLQEAFNEGARYGYGYGGDEMREHFRELLEAAEGVIAADVLTTSTDDALAKVNRLRAAISRARSTES